MMTDAVSDSGNTEANIQLISTIITLESAILSLYSHSLYHEFNF